MSDEHIFSEQPLDNESFDSDELEEEIELVDADEELDASDDEEMSEEPEGDEEDDGDSVPEEDEEDDDSVDVATDEEKARILRELEELRSRERRREYERQQAENRKWWANIEARARAYFNHEYNKIMENKDRYLDPDAYVAEKMQELMAQSQDWYARFYASQNEVRRQQYEAAAIPTYAARVASYFHLTKEQAQTLLDDYEPDQFVREAKKMAAANAREAALRKQIQQKRRSDARDRKSREWIGTGSGRGAPKKVRRGSDRHLEHLLRSGGVIS